MNEYDQLDQLLRQHYADKQLQSLDEQIDLWLAEDLTDEYDRIVAEQEAAIHRPQFYRRLAIWLSAAAAIALLAGMGLWLWPRTEQPQRAQKVALPTDRTEEGKEWSTDSRHAGERSLASAQALPGSRSTSGGEGKAIPPTEARTATARFQKKKETAETRSDTPERPATAAHNATAAHKATADSLDYYLARLEKMLDDMGDSVYQERAEQIIRADVRLQRIVQKVYMNELDKQENNNQALYLKY